MKSILIEGKPYYYKEVDLSESNSKDITFSQAKSILFETKKILCDKNIPFYLVFGTLLGAIREKSFIAHDYDVDIMIFDIDGLKKNIPYFESKGLKLCRVVEPFLYSFVKDDVYIDIYIISNAKSIFGLWCYRIADYSIPKKYLKSFETINFLGEEFQIPSNPESILQFWYGKNWRIPMKGYHGRGDIYPIYLYRKVKTKLLTIIKKISY